MFPGFGSLTSFTGGGALTPSSSAGSGSDQQASNDVATGNITVGGLNLAPKSSGIDSEVILQAAAIGGLVLGGVWAFKKIAR
ncbi:hypothetical protein [Microbulbifer sp. ARAS458-1]|uniref:hypothetical protein n=1 Tax=Microbulbifer sp. ARAS458-1 TaxID=3140242 RepID=UPI0038781A3C